jgi:hypothetical protein
VVHHLLDVVKSTGWAAYLDSSQTKSKYVVQLLTMAFGNLCCTRESNIGNPPVKAQIFEADGIISFVTPGTLSLGLQCCLMVLKLHMAVVDC